MAKRESVQKKLDKVRPPRVQLTYDVEIGDAIEQKELPFAVGVLGDFSGKQDPNNPQAKLKDRKFVNVDMDNFDEVMKGLAPKASFSVDNKLSGDGSKLGVNLEFNKFDDFRPEAIAEQVEPLRKLLEARTKLSDLRNKIAGNEALEDILADVLSNTEKLNQLSKETKNEE